MKLTDDNILQANINRTKQYVRDYGGKVSTLPTATSSNVGQIYQYTGATTLTYTHGYFYECKQNGGTYSWENVPVGAGDIQIQSDWNQTDNTQKDYIKNKPIIPSAQVNADWTASSGVAEILHKPALGTASALDVATSGNASTSQVVKGDDTRLTDSRNAADVYSWAKAENKPSYTASEVGAIASTDKGANNGVAELDSTGKVPSSQLPSYVDDVLEYNSQSAFPSTGETGKIYIAKDTNKTYRWSGTAYVEISKSLALGETSSTAYAGNKGKANADAISAIKDGSTIDSFGDVESALSDKISKSSTAGLVKNDGTIDTTSYVSDISGKADKVSSATNNHFAALDANGNLKDSGHKHSDYLTQHQDISGKADKVSGATNGNFAGLDENGNLADSGKKASDFLTSHQTIKQDGVTGATVNRFGECTTQASVNDKYVAITEGTFSLEAGAKVTVKFRYTNTATSPRLKVGNTLAQDIYYRGVQVGPSAPAGVLNGVIDFVYDGSHYNIVGTFVNTTYESKEAVSGGTALSLVTTGEKYIWNNAVSGGHTILDGSGTAMTQRGKLQFEGADVVDDGTNDKTIVKTTPQSMIGDAWLLNHAYAVGDYSIDANGLYKNGTAHTSTATNRPSVNQSGYWTLVSVAGELKTGINLSVFNDLSSFTAPTINANRCTITSGGYKVVGNLVYIYITYTVNDSSNWQQAGSIDLPDYWQLFMNFPKPKRTTPLELGGYQQPQLTFAEIRPMDTAQQGYINLMGIPRKKYSVETVIQGVYEKA